MKIITKRLFIIAYCIYYSGMVIAQTSFPLSDTIKKVCILISLTIFFLSIVSRGEKYLFIKKKGFLLFIFIITILIISFASKDYFIFMLIIMGMSVPNYDEEYVKKIFMLSILITIVVSACAIIACALGMIPNVNTPRGWNAPVRLAWGFGHSQMLSLLTFYSLMYYYATKKIVRKRDMFFGILLLGTISKIFDARNSLYALIFFYLLCGVSNILKRINGNSFAGLNKLFVVMAKICPIVMVCITFALENLYAHKNKIALQINDLLSNRLRSTHWNLETVPIKLFRAVSYDEYEAMLRTAVDNGYLYIILRYGLIYLIFLFAVFWLMIRFYKENNNVVGCIALLSIAISIYVSNSITNCYFIPFWLISLTMIKKKIWSSPYILTQT